MTKLEKKLRASLRRLAIVMPPRSAKKYDSPPSVVVAVSGGADSTALLDAMVRLSKQNGQLVEIMAAHLNHQLRGTESDEDERFVRELAVRLDVPIFVERIATAEQAQAAKRNLEATAREFRYKFLHKVGRATHADFIFTAHTQDDQAETILMRLLRGTGAEGMRGIHESLLLGEGSTLMRPLLSVTRAEVIAHCEHYGLAFCSDSSNLSTDFMRNRVRHELLPSMRTFNPRIETVLVRTGELLSQDDDYLSGLAAHQVAVLEKKQILTVTSLLNHPLSIRRRIFRLWLKTHCGDLRRINFSHIEAINGLTAPGQSGKRVELPDGWIVLREYDGLRLIQGGGLARDKTLAAVPVSSQGQSFGSFTCRLIRHLSREQAEQILVQDGQQCETALLSETKELDGLLLRTRRPGDAYMAAGHQRLRKLKTLMIRHKIPLSVRSTYPILTTADGEIVWAPGLPVSQRFLFNETNSSQCALVLAEKLGMD